jgi:hypothetical protein
LHEEIVDILRDRGHAMSTAEIAAAVNARGRYVKRDGSPVTPFQIHGRTRNYSELFARDGSTVRLRRRKERWRAGDFFARDVAGRERRRGG